MATDDPEFYQAPKFTPEPYPTRREHGCFFYGCIIASVLALLAVVAIGVVTYLGFRLLGRVVEEWTATAPSELPKVEMPAEEREVLKDRVNEFKTAVASGAPSEPLVLTSTELNALIEEDPNLKGKIFVTIEGDKVKGKVSLPLDALAKGPFRTMLQGRYLNGEAELKAWLKDGTLFVTLDSIEVNGKRPPEEFMRDLRQQNLAKDAYKDPKQAEWLSKVESMEIRDGKIIIKVRPKSSETAKKIVRPSTTSEDSSRLAPGPKSAAPPEAKPAPPPAEAPLPKS
jgi:hypothetical protein